MTVTSYWIVDNATGGLVGRYKGTDLGRRMARRRADKLDLAYGAIRYTVRPNYSMEALSQ